MAKASLSPRHPLSPRELGTIRYALALLDCTEIKDADDAALRPLLDGEDLLDTDAIWMLITKLDKVDEVATCRLKES